MVILATILALCLTAQEIEAARNAMLDGLDIALRRQVQKLIDVRYRDRDKDPARITRGMREIIEQHAKSRRAVLQWSPPLCNPPLPTPRPNTG